MVAVRKSAVAGQFYPADPCVLGTTVATLLEDAGLPAGPPPKALIAPHAGYIYSGPVAATAYARLRPHRDLYRRVVLLGPCHYVGIAGCALPGAEVFRTPLGDVRIDRGFVDDRRIPGLAVNDAAHAPEHSLEVHLPFLQSVLGDFSLVPIVVGETRADEAAAVLEALWDGPETLIVISSDLSHYLPYERARVRDRTTCERIERLVPNGIGPDDACGCRAVNGLIELAKKKRLTVETLDMRNSGDTAGPRDRVVGYGAWAVTEARKQ